MQGKRTERIAALVKHKIASAITRDLKDPRIGFVTITDVYMSDDLKHARVFYSVMGAVEKIEETQNALYQARGFLQRDLAKTLNLRFTPQLSFIRDSSLDEGMKIDGIIRKIHEE